MNKVVSYTATFKRKFKRYNKKFPTLHDDLVKLLDSIVPTLVRATRSTVGW